MNYQIPAKGNRWFVVINNNGVHYPFQNDSFTLFELWDDKPYLKAVYGPATRHDAITYAQDMNLINAADIDFSRPNTNSIYRIDVDLDDDDYDDYVGIIS